MLDLVRFAPQAAKLALVSGFLCTALPALAMSYRLVDADLPGCAGSCPKVIVASGTIGQNEHVQFLNFLRQSLQQGAVAQVMVLESPGGFTIGGLALAQVLRKLKVSVIVGGWAGGTVTRQGGLRPGTCASACVFALAGGASRYYVSGSRVGVHRSHSGTVVLDPTTRSPVNASVDHEKSHAIFRQFFGSMGVDQRIVSKIEQTPPSSIYWLTAAEMTQFRLARDSSTRSGSARRR